MGGTIPAPHSGHSGRGGGLSPSVFAGGRRPRFYSDHGHIFYGDRHFQDHRRHRHALPQLGLGAGKRHYHLYSGPFDQEPMAHYGVVGYGPVHRHRHDLQRLVLYHAIPGRRESGDSPLTSKLSWAGHRGARKAPSAWREHSGGQGAWRKETE